MKKNKFIFVDWCHYEQSCLSIIESMINNKYRPDCVIGLLRGGIMPARIFSDYFDILLDFYAIDIKNTDGIGKWKESPIIRNFDLENISEKDILIVDDIWDTGRTMTSILEKLNSKSVTTATLFWRENSIGCPTYYCDIANENEWIVFPWEKNEFNKQTGLKFGCAKELRERK